MPGVGTASPAIVMKTISNKNQASVTLAPTGNEILAWIDANPEGFSRIVVRKSWGRKVWWRGPDGDDCDTLRECISRAIKGFPLPNNAAQTQPPLS